MSSFLGLSVDEQLCHFNTLCSNVLDFVAHFKTKKLKLQVKPWLNNATRTSRQEWRKAERKCKEDKLQVSYDIMRVFCKQRSVKMTWEIYFASLIAKPAHSPKILFNTIDQVLNPSMLLQITDASPTICEHFQSLNLSPPSFFF